ncbi:MAG: Nitrogen regulatory protein PII [uncultured bacterium]|nr:MAG: Nitrogen regulatory protein PII [uncultured bacterium]
MTTYKKIVAIVRIECLESVENHLHSLDVPGISVTKIKGYGEYANFYSTDWMSMNAHIEIYCQSDQVDSIVHGIMEKAHSGSQGDGIVVVSPVESIYRIRTKSKV